jgi:hypothetical protein
MHAMTTMQGNLSAMGKAVQEAQDKSDKLNKKGGKANAQKVELATKKLESANDNWNTEAPHIFETLQLVDEKRVNILRDVLTEYQTFEMEQIESSRLAVAEVLTHVVDVEAMTEILGFVNDTTQGRQRRPLQRAPASMSNNGSALVPPPSAGADSVSQFSDHTGAGVGGTFKRIGTVINRRRQSIHGGFARAPSPSKGFGSFSRGNSSRDGATPSPQASSNNLREMAAHDNRLSSLIEAPASPPANHSQPTHGESRTNGGPESHETGGDGASHAPNGTVSRDISDLSDVQPPSGPPPSHLKAAAAPETQTDSEGYTVRPTVLDPISQAQQEAAEEAEQQQFKLDIRNEPIREEDADAQAALSNVANTLRSNHLVTPNRKAGTVRGRRDVRNTMYMPPGQTFDFSTPENLAPTSPSISSSRAAAFAENHAPSDTQSIRSAHSLSSGAAIIKHPELTGSGLKASIVETVSCQFEHEEIKSITAIGEVALAHNDSEIVSTGSYYLPHSFKTIANVSSQKPFV